MLSKSKDPLILEAVAKGRGAWGVLHKWLGSIDQAGRTAAEVLANLAAEPVVSGQSQHQVTRQHIICKLNRDGWYEHLSSAQGILVATLAHQLVCVAPAPLLLSPGLQSRAALLKASEGDVPWTSYCYVLERCLCHPVVSSVCKLIKSLTHQVGVHAFA